MRGYRLGVRVGASSMVQRFLRQYAWFLAKNVLGWALIFSSFVVGPLVPGPGGIPMFVLGFALVTFPGKRRLTTRVLRGRLLPPATQRYRRIAWVIGIAVPLILAVSLQFFPAMKEMVQQRGWSPFAAGVIVYCVVALVLMGVMRILPMGINLLLRTAPRIRRKVRPTLRHFGIRLLPPRWHLPQPHRSARVRKAEEEIIHIHESFKLHLAVWWKKLRPWLPKIIGLIVVPIIFYRLLKPIWEQWDSLRSHVEDIRWDLLAVACLMFAANQYVCRVRLWHGVLRGLGWRMPEAPATRIWIKSELARYIPGAIWQVVGRAYLAKPYGLPTSVCSISQVLEFVMNLIAAALIAVIALSIAGSRISEEAHRYVIVALVLIPLLLLLLVPQIFHPGFNWLLRKMHKPQLERRLSMRRTLGLLLLACMSQLWLGLAAWLVTRSLLHIPFEQAYILAGAYCLAWAAGVSAGAMAPAGIGFREYILSITLLAVIPPEITRAMDGPTRVAFFAFVAVVLRLWATIGELMFAGVGFLWDWPGMRGRVTAVASELKAG